MTARNLGLQRFTSATTGAITQHWTTMDISGLLILDKPAGVTSAGLLNRIKRHLPRKIKFGHAGTLDPFATGILIGLLGKATRQCESMMDQPKTYLATIKLGANTATDDPETVEIPVEHPPYPDRDTLLVALRTFVGTILQRPPAYSAIKVAGRRAYELARKGTVVELPPRPVRIDAVRLLDYTWPTAVVQIDCGRGVYIRSIARTLGEQLQTGGYLIALRRTRVGPYTTDHAVTIEQLERDGVAPHLLPIHADDSHTSNVL